MKRRDFVKQLALGASGAALGSTPMRVYAAPSDYTGQLLVVLQLDGGWDVTSFCDPKSNQPGERVINHWASSASIRTAGRIHYAPFAANQRLFDSHHAKMLVINGVDAQTNSHTTGVLHNWSGRNAAGLPTLTALFAAARAPELPLAYVNNGGFVHTAGLLRYSRLNDYDALIDLLDPVVVPWERERNLRRPGDISRVQRFQRAALERRLASPTLTPRQRANVEAYLGARDSRSSLSDLLNRLPTGDAIQAEVALGGGLNQNSDLLRQIQLTLLTFQSGVGAAADLMFGGFDTHVNHDAQHAALYSHLADALDYFWAYAEELGIANRITLVLGSDFGRTPFYNADNGKDHWPIGSYIVMEQAPEWGSRVVGVTDGAHNALRIDPTSLARDDANGIILHPKHVHQALRRYLGIDDFAVQQGLSFGVTEDVDLFAPNKWTQS